MRRWLVILLVALALLVLLSPGIIGHLVERNLADSITRSQIESPAITISTEHFERGWFSSVGRHRIAFIDRDALPLLAAFAERAGYDKMPGLILDSRIDHGLVAVASMSRENGSMTPAIARLLVSLQLDPGNGELVDLPGNLFIDIDLIGKTSVRLVLQQGRWQSGDAEIVWQGADLQVSLGTNGALTSIEGFVAPIRMSAGDDALVTGRIEVSARRRRGAYDVDVGTVRVNSEAVNVTNSSGQMSGYSSLAFTSQSDIVDGKLDGSSRLDITGIDVPTFGAVDIGLDLAYSGFDAASFARLYNAFRDAATDGNPDDAFAALYPSMDAELQQFLSAGAELRFERLNISLPQGTIEMDLFLSLPRSGRGDAFSWPGLLHKLKASINLTLPVAVFEVLVAMQPEIRVAVAMGYLLKQGDEFKMSLEYSQGLATANGLPAPVPMPGAKR